MIKSLGLELEPMQSARVGQFLFGSMGHRSSGLIGFAAKRDLQCEQIVLAAPAALGSFWGVSHDR